MICKICGKAVTRAFLALKAKNDHWCSFGLMAIPSAATGHMHCKIKAQKRFPSRARPVYLADSTRRNEPLNAPAQRGAFKHFPHAYQRIRGNGWHRLFLWFFFCRASGEKVFPRLLNLLGKVGNNGGGVGGHAAPPCPGQAKHAGSSGRTFSPVNRQRESGR